MEPTTEKIDWVEKAIQYEATPKRLREQKTDNEFIESIGVPRSTYYREMSKRENQERIIKISFEQAKKRTPQILDKLGQKAEEGDSTSIGQFMDYVLEKTKKSEVDLKVEPIKGINFIYPDGYNSTPNDKTDPGV